MCVGNLNKLVRFFCSLVGPLKRGRWNISSLVSWLTHTPKVDRRNGVSSVADSPDVRVTVDARARARARVKARAI